MTHRRTRHALAALLLAAAGTAVASDAPPDKAKSSSKLPGPAFQFPGVFELNLLPVPTGQPHTVRIRNIGAGPTQKTKLHFEVNVLPPGTRKTCPTPIGDFESTIDPIAAGGTVQRQVPPPDHPVPPSHPTKGGTTCEFRAHAWLDVKIETKGGPGNISVSRKFTKTY